MLATPTTIHATSFVMISDEALADETQIIAEMRVLDVDGKTNTGEPVTHYTMAVEHLIRGEIAASPLTVRVFGGEMPSGLGLHIHGAPRFAENDKALLFLQPRQDGTYGIRHFLLGAFHLVQIDGREVAIRQLAEAEEIEVPGKAFVQRGPRDSGLFRTWLEDRTAGVERQADYFVEVADAALATETLKFSLIANPPIRFREFDSGGGVVFRSHVNGQPGLASGGVTEFQNAMRAWRNDPNTPINLVYGGTTTDAQGLESFDGTNAILYDDPNNEFDAPFRCGGGGTVAMAGPWIDGSTHNFNGTQFRTAIGADIVTNDGIDCNDNGNGPWIALAGRAEAVFAHELGHTLGLGHACDEAGLPSCNSSQALSLALMRPTVQDNRGAAFTSDDLNGIRFLYGAPVTLPAAPSNLTANPASPTQIDLAWNDNASDETSFDVQRSSNGGFSTIRVLGANTRTFSDTNVLPGTTYNYRLRARNSAGVSGFSNTASATTISNAEPCVPSPTTLCLNEGRFKVEVNWRTPTNQVGPGTDLGLPSADSGLMWFFTLSNWEMLIKVLDGCSINNRFWVFAAATTDVEYDVTVTDSFTGFSKVYSNQQGNAAPAITDTEAFTTCDATPPPGFLAPAPEPGKVAPSSRALAGQDPAGQNPAEQDPAGQNPAETASTVTTRTVPEKIGVCTPSATRLCLNGGRFAVELDWVTSSGDTGFGQVDAFQSDDSGLMYFFSAENLELLVKVLDGCAITDRVWVFAAATTNVQYTLRVTDTQTGIENSYFNPLDNASDAITDTMAFDACPL